MNDLKKFSIQDIDLFRDDENVDFAIARLGFLASGDNGQDSPISEEVLRRDASTVLGKFVVADYSPWKNDATTHTTEEVIIGYVPSDGKLEFETLPDGRVMAYIDAVISKIYGTNIYELFKTDNYRSVSSEFSCIQDSPNEDGTGEVLSFEVRGITILGKDVRPAIEGANIQIKKFSLNDVNSFYDSYNNPLKNFAEDRRKRLEQKGNKNFPVNTSKEAVDMGDWNGDKAKHDLMDSKNYDSIGSKVCLDFTKGDRKLENCKYPVMNIKKDEWVYNAEGLSSAMAYAAQHDPEIYKKAIALQKKLGLYKDDKKEESMEEDKKKDAPVEEEKDKVEDKKMSDTEKNPEAPKTDEKEAPKEEPKKDEDTKKDDAKEEKKEDKKFSLDAYADNGAYLTMLQNETEQNQQLAQELLAQDDMNVIMSKVFELNTKCAELKKFKDDIEMAETKDKVDKTLADVKDKVDSDSYKKFYDEGKACSAENVAQFVAKVKAFAYDVVTSKESNDDGIMKFAIGNSSNNNDTKDVFAKYLD